MSLFFPSSNYSAFFPKEYCLQVVSKTVALHGGRLVSILDENGHMRVGVEYDREQVAVEMKEFRESMKNNDPEIC